MQDDEFIIALARLTARIGDGYFVLAAFSIDKQYSHSWESAQLLMKQQEQK